VGLAAACRYGATEVRVALDTDAPPERTLTIRVYAREGNAEAANGDVVTWRRGGAMGTIELPASFGVIPGAGRPRDEAVTLVVQA
jgi:hypothetical protein